MTLQAGKDKGLTLVEVLVSVALLGLGLVFILPSMVRISYALEVAEAKRLAYFFSVSKMAQVELNFREGIPPEEEDQGQFRSEGRQFQWDLLTSDIPDHPGFHSVLLAVHWRQGDRTYRREFPSLMKLQQEEEEP